VKSRTQKRGGKRERERKGMSFPSGKAGRLGWSSGEREGNRSGKRSLPPAPNQKKKKALYYSYIRGKNGCSDLKRGEHKASKGPPVDRHQRMVGSRKVFFEGTFAILCKRRKFPLTEEKERASKGRYRGSLRKFRTGEALKKGREGMVRKDLKAEGGHVKVRERCANVSADGELY